MAIRRCECCKGALNGDGRGRSFAAHLAEHEGCRNWYVELNRIVRLNQTWTLAIVDTLHIERLTKYDFLVRGLSPDGTLIDFLIEEDALVAEGRRQAAWDRWGRNARTERIVRRTAIDTRSGRQ